MTDSGKTQFDKQQLELMNKLSESATRFVVQYNERFIKKLTDSGTTQMIEQYKKTMESFKFPVLSTMTQYNQELTKILSNSGIALVMEQHQELIKNIKNSAIAMISHHNQELMSRLNNSEIKQIIKQQQDIMSIAIPEMLDNLNEITKIYQDSFILTELSSEEIIEDYDWRTFEPTEDEVEIATEAIVNNETLLYDIKNNNISTTIFIIIRFILLFFSLFIERVEDFIEYKDVMTDISEEVIASYIEKDTLKQYKKRFAPLNHYVRKLSAHLKKYIPIALLSKIRLTIADPILLIFEYRNKKSKKIGRIPPLSIVMIIKKRRNWSYVYYKNPEDGTELEGWTFTRYLKKIR